MIDCTMKECLICHERYFAYAKHSCNEKGGAADGFKGGTADFRFKHGIKGEWV